MSNYADVIELSKEEAQFLGYEHDDAVQYTLTEKALIIYTKAAIIEGVDDVRE